MSGLLASLIHWEEMMIKKILLGLGVVSFALTSTAIAQQGGI